MVASFELCKVKVFISTVYLKCLQKERFHLIIDPVTTFRDVFCKESSLSLKFCTFLKFSVDTIYISYQLNEKRSYEQRMIWGNVAFRKAQKPLYNSYRSGQPIPIEYLPAEHTLDSRCGMKIRKNVEIKKNISQSSASDQIPGSAHHHHRSRGPSWLQAGDPGGQEPAPGHFRYQRDRQGPLQRQICRAHWW